MLQLKKFPTCCRQSGGKKYRFLTFVLFLGFSQFLWGQVCSLTPDYTGPIQLCVNSSGVVSLTWDICASPQAGNIAGEVHIELPKGFTALNETQLKQEINLSAGQCITLTVATSTAFTQTGLLDATLKAVYSCAGGDKQTLHSTEVISISDCDATENNGNTFGGYETCGTFTKLGGLPQGYKGKVYWDRFGNQYTEDELVSSQSQANATCTSGVFLINFAGVPEIYQPTICEVFSYLSGLVSDPNSPQGTVPVLVNWTYDCAGAGAASDFFTSDCGGARSYVLENIRLGKNLLPIGQPAGKLCLNANINWYIGSGLMQLPEDNQKIDLYTVVLHEAMHILGFASLIKNGGAANNSIFSTYDRLLNQQNGQTHTPLIVTGNDPDCCSRMVYNTSAPINFNEACEMNLFLYENNNEIAEVNSLNETGTSASSLDNIPNKLSHLDIRCGDNSMGNQYVMHPGIGKFPEPFSSPRRVVTQAERDILCQIGYKKDAPCLPCVVIANDDVLGPIFTTVNDEIDVNVLPYIVDGLTANDVYSYNPSSPNFIANLCGYDSEGITVTRHLLIPGQEHQTYFTIKALTPGVWTFCYSITDNNCGACDEATVTVVVLEQPIEESICEDEESCNLICFGDFEDFFPLTSGYYLQLNKPEFYFEDISMNHSNSPDIYLQTDVTPTNTVLRWGRSENKMQDQECIRIPLANPVYPGCTVTMSYEAAVANLGSYSLPPSIFIEVYGITSEPCMAIAQAPYWNGIGDNYSPLCPGVNIYGMNQNSSVFFDSDVAITQNTDLQNLNLMSYPPFTYTHPIDAEPITDLLIWGNYIFTDTNNGVEFYMDNINISSSCDLPITITPVVLKECIDDEVVIEYNVCLQGEITTPQNIQLQVDIPDGYENLLTIMPGGGFDGNGIAEITLTPDENCGVINSATLLLKIKTNGVIIPGTGLDILMNLLSENLCLRNSFDNQTAHIVFEDCGVSALCPCPEGANSYTIGTNSGSLTEMSQSSFPQNVAIDGACIAINGKVIWDMPAAVTTISNSEITFGPASELIIPAGKHLELTGNNIHGCDKMWKGFTVQNNGKITLLKNSNISDAQYAVKLEPNAILRIENNVFDKNYVSLYTPPSAGNITQSIVNEGIERNTFTCTGNLLPLYGGQFPVPGKITHAGIALNNVAGVSIGANTFENIANAVKANRSGFTIKGSIISNMTANTDGDIDQYGIYATICSAVNVFDCMFKNYADGIYASRSNLHVEGNSFSNNPALVQGRNNAAIACVNGTHRNIRIINNPLIESTRYGIYINNCLNAAGIRIKNNEDIRILPGATERTGIYMGGCNSGWVDNNRITTTQLANKYHGMVFKSCGKVNVLNNRVSDTRTGVLVQGDGGNYFAKNSSSYTGTTFNGAPDATGFRIYNSPNEYCGNSIDGHTGSGMYFEGACDLQNSLTCNTFGDAKNGLLLHTDGSYTTLIGKQINQGNQWTGSYGEWGAYHASMDDAEIDMSHFEVPPSDPILSNWNTGLGNGLGLEWFTEYPEISLNCSNACRLPVDADAYWNDPKKTEKTPEKIADNDLSTAKAELSGKGVLWMQQQRLYERLKQYPELMTGDAELSLFYEDAELMPLGALYEVEAGIDNLLGRGVEVEEQAGELQHQMAGADSLLRALQAAALPPDEKVVKIAQIQTQLRNLNNTWYGTEEWIAEQRTAEKLTVSTQNAAISTEHPCGLNEYVLNNVYLEHQLWQEAATSEDARKTLRKIADQCPITGGLSVYQARNLVLLFDPEAEWTDTDCNSTQERSKEKQADDLMVNIHPNPANDYLLIAVEQTNTNAQLRLDLINVYGQLIQSGELNSGNTMRLSTAHIPAGVYYYIISSGGHSGVKKGKVVIIH